MQEKVKEAVAKQDQNAVMKRVFLSPAVVVLLALSIFPLLWSLGMSFTDFQRGNTRAAEASAEASGEVVEQDGFLGLGFDITLENYERMLSDQRLHATIRNTLFYVFVGVIIQYLAGFGLALLLNQDFFGRNLVRVIFLMPMMMTPVAAAYTGRMMFDSSISPLAQFQRTLTSFVQSIPGGLFEDTVIRVPWLTDGAVAPLTMVLIDSWQWIPFMTLLLLAGMQTIPDEIYEAARVDGASAWRILRSITFPILLPISATVILIRGLEIFKIIDVIMVTTGGGPGNSTESLTMYIFETALSFGNYAYAASISFALLITVIIFATVFLAGMRRITPR